MLRRYLIVNGTATALLYGGIYAGVPSATHLVESVQDLFASYVMESPVLGPLINKVVLVTSCL
ncbi:MAG TPA: hypothetical protein PKE16_19580 [Hyphomicrobium sp.]|nr:hypothetical protein [Hyphomicrobium sp.]